MKFRNSWRATRLSAGLGAAATAAMLGVAPASADYGFVNVLTFSPKTIEVESNGMNYTKATQSGLKLNVKLQIDLDAEFSGKVKWWKAWPEVRSAAGDWVKLDKYYEQASYGLPRPKEVHTQAVIDVPGAEIGAYAVALCNIEAERLRGVQMANDDIFKQDRKLPVAIRGGLAYEMTGINGQAEGPPQVNPYGFNPENGKHFDVICKADPNAGPHRVPQAKGPSVESVSFGIEELATVGGACKLYLEGEIVSKKPNQEVKFRYEDMAGKKSALHTVETGASKAASFSHQYDLAGTGRKNGSIKVAIQGESTESGWQYYDVTCRENAPNGLAGNHQDPVIPAVGVTTVVLPDLMATPLGLSFAGGKQPWGSTVVVSNPAHAAATGVGPKNKHCRFEQVAFRPFNKGDAASGPFKTRVFRDNTMVEQEVFDLAAHDGLPSNSGWHKFDIELPQGRSTIKVALDTAQTVVEQDETNNVYTVEVDVKFPCAGAVNTLADAASADDDDDGGSKRKLGKRTTGTKLGKRLKHKAAQ